MKIHVKEVRHMCAFCECTSIREAFSFIHLILYSISMISHILLLLQ